jgi:hypothetical protein
MIGAIFFGIGCFYAGEDLSKSVVDDGYDFIVLGILF